MTKIALIFAILLIVSCNSKSEDEIATDESTTSVFNKKFKNRVVMDSLKNRIYSGDTIAYKEARDIYILSGYSQEFLYYAMIMSSKFHYEKAREDIVWIFGASKDSLDSKSKTYIESFEKEK